jgi:hypothetical protein
VCDVGAAVRLTHHAVEQFASRWGGGEALLAKLVVTAQPTTLRTPKGQAIWTIEHAGATVRLVVKWDRGEREPICVTVLGPDARESGVLLAGEEPVESAPMLPSAPASWADDPHLAAASAEMDAARSDAILAQEMFEATRSFLQSAKRRLHAARSRHDALVAPREGAKS